MIYIDKSFVEEPSDLKEYIEAQTTNQLALSYRSMPKEGVRAALFKAQGGLCCYCMNTIGKDNSSIEHFLPQKQAENYQVAFHNLFLACKYSEGKGKGEDIQHCDKRKGDKLIPNYLSSKDCASYFAYNLSAGEILPRILTIDGKPNWERQEKFASVQDCQKRFSELSDVQQMVLVTIETLNLNSRLLTAQRKKYGKKLLPILISAGHDTLVKMRQKTEKRQNDMWEKFVGIKRYFLDQRIHSLQS